MKNIGMQTAWAWGFNHNLPESQRKTILGLDTEISREVIPDKTNGNE